MAHNDILQRFMSFNHPFNLKEMPNTWLKTLVSQDRRAKAAIKKGNGSYP